MLPGSKLVCNRLPGHTKSKTKLNRYLPMIIVMVTVNSHQVFAVLNLVIKISAPYVLIRGT